MPLKRYEIRNEYSLADPELYKAADKDDPEAILEGVAMAGLVGVLRQLGDLAEFAAEIFHDLHEEVMTTASRGHGLIVRVQQLEAEFPLIERKLLSQTSHTSFLYNPGVDWRSNLLVDQNRVTQGDLPRFVMDSYEECRGPPRLFLLDKFDVAGAGACLKRFTDPSFFKTEYASSADRKLEAQREKKTRRVKKRGPRWRNGETPESFPSSHAKLHQLFLEERIESGGNDPDRHVKLKKRQFTGSLFNPENTKSYMEKFLDTCPPEQRIVHEIIDPLALTWTSNNASESSLEIVEIGTASPLKEIIEYDQGLCPSPDIGKVLEKTPIDEAHVRNLNVSIDGDALKVLGDDCSSYGGNISSTITQVAGGDNFAHRESKSGVDTDDWQETDDAASEIDDYVDALAVIESEVETDSECKKYSSYLSLKPDLVDSIGSFGQPVLHGKYVDSQSVSNSSTSGDSSNLSRERGNSSRGNSVISLAEDTSDFDGVVADDPSIPASISDNENKFSDHRFTTEEITGSETENPAMAHMADFKANGVPDTSHLQDTKIFSTENHAGFEERDLGNAIVATGLADFSEKADKGHRSSEYSMHEEGHISDVYSDTLADAKSTSDLLEIESHNTHSVCSSFEEHSKDMGQADEDACSDISSSVKQSFISDSECPEADTQNPALDTGNNIDIQEKHSDTRHFTPSPDVLAPLGCKEDPVCEVASDLTEHEQEVSVGKMLDGFLMIGKPSFSLDLLKSENELQKLQSEIIDTAVSEHCQTEANELDPGNRTVFGREVGRNATERDDVGQDFITTYPDQNNTAEMIAHLDDCQTNVLDVEAMNDKIGDKTDVFSNGAIFSDIHSNESDSIKAAGNGADLGPLVKKLEPVETVAYSSMPANCKDEHDIKGDCLSTSVHSEILQDELISVSEDCHQDGDNKVDEGRSDLVESLPPPGLALDTASKVTALYEHGASLARNNLDSDTQTSSYVESDSYIDASAVYNQCEPFVSKHPPQSSEHKLEGTTESSASGAIIGTNHELGSEMQLVYPLEFPALSTSPSDHRTNLEPPALPPLPPMQWRLGRFQNPPVAPERQLVHPLVPAQTARLPIVNHTLAPVQPIAVPAGHYAISPSRETTLPTLAPVAPMILPAHQHQTAATAHTASNEGQSGSSDGYAALHRVAMTVVPALSEGFSHSGMNAVGKQEHLMFSVPTTGYMALQGGFTLPIISTVSEVNSPDNHLFAPSISTGPQTGSQFFGNFHLPNGNPPNSETSYGGPPDHKLSVIGATEEETVNSSGHFLPMSMGHQTTAGFVASEAERNWLSTYDGIQNHAGVNTNGSFQKKLPRPRNPLIDEVVAIDKSKFRKVERVKPSLESKADEIESRLEQMQLRKVEKAKQPTETNVLDGGYVLEHLQLRKVAERVRPPVEPKSEEREFLPEQLQLKKVAERYKAESEPKAEETGSPRVHLRKVSERVKQESEARTEETESPRVQLRKVGDRVKQEIETRIEETGSPQVQLRKVGEKAQSMVESKTEERHSLFEQIKNKSFSLKPAVAARPNFEGPRTNLKVAAILEKASNIRQAMVGSDEDDDADTWE